MVLFSLKGSSAITFKIFLMIFRPQIISGYKPCNLNLEPLCHLGAAEVLYPLSQSPEGDECYLAIAIKEIVIGFRLDILMDWLE